MKNNYAENMKKKIPSKLAQWTRMEFLAWLIVGVILLTHMVFEYHFLGIKDLTKNKKTKKFFKGHSKGHRSIL